MFHRRFKKIPGYFNRSCKGDKGSFKGVSSIGIYSTRICLQEDEEKIQAEEKKLMIVDK